MDLPHPSNSFSFAYFLKISQCKNTAVSLAVESCDFYIAPDSQKYEQSGHYTFILENAKGCDSTITLNLTISEPEVYIDEIVHPECMRAEGSINLIENLNASDFSYVWNNGSTGVSL